MDEKLDYTSGEQIRKVSNSWMRGRDAGSIDSLERDPSLLYLQYKNYHLHLVQKKEEPSIRPAIPSEKFQRYAFFRSYTMPTHKTQIITFSVASGATTLLWAVLLGTFFKSLPHIYVQIFLAAYSPEEHMYIPKMVPLLYGHKITLLLSSLSHVFYGVFHGALLLGCVVHGLLFKNPWNKCGQRIHHMTGNLTLTCLSIPEFRRKVNNTAWNFSELYYTAANGEKFQLAQKEHFREKPGVARSIIRSWIVDFVRDLFSKNVYFGTVSEDSQQHGLNTSVFKHFIPYNGETPPLYGGGPPDLMLYAKVMPRTLFSVHVVSWKKYILLFVVYALLILCRQAVFKKAFWKKLIRLQHCWRYYRILLWIWHILRSHTLISLITIYYLTLFTKIQLLVTFLEVLLYFYMSATDDYSVSVSELPPSRNDEMLPDADIDMLAEALNVPPVLHVLTSRSTEDIQPNADSFMACFSIAAYYLFKGMMASKLRTYCKNTVLAPLQMTQFRGRSWYYFWPIVFSRFYIGDLLTLLWFTLFFIIDLLCAIIEYACLTEVVIWEWRWIKKNYFDIFGAGLFCLTVAFVESDTRIWCHIYIKGILTWVETIALFWIYPTGRLTDDVRFHAGFPPTKLNELLLRFMPAYYGYKIYKMLSSLGEFRKKPYFMEINEWLFIFSPYVLGMVFIIYKYVVSEKRGWVRLIVPEADWGPKDREIRNLRKAYDSRTYIGSQAPRELSRYVFDKKDAKAFQLDVNYDPNRRSTMRTSMFRMEPGALD